MTKAEDGSIQDPFGLLEQNDSVFNSSRALSPLASRMLEIKEYADQEGRLPSDKNLYEIELRGWWDEISRRSDLSLKLADEGLGPTELELRRLEGPDNQIRPVLMDPFDLLNSARPSGIQDLRNVKSVERAKAEHIARREPCPSFGNFAALFESAVSRLEKGILVPTMETTGRIENGRFVILNDLLGYVASSEKSTELVKFNSGNRNRDVGRVLVIFENQTQSNMLLRSLEKAILESGYLLVEASPKSVDIPHTAGFLYVVRSLREMFRGQEDVLKIGFTTTSIQQRLGRTTTEAAYLFGEVELLANYRCIGVDAAKLEEALHAFFADARLDMEIDMGDGTVLHPQEWFKVPLDAVDRAIFLALEGKLSSFTYSRKDGIQAN